MVYLESFVLPTEHEEWTFHMTNTKSKMTCFNNFYPFGIFFLKEIDVLYFSKVTILSGKNGSGKTTLLNAIGEKLKLKRFSNFNKSYFYNDFINLCKVGLSDNYSKEIEENSLIITSDDVFNRLLIERDYNDSIDKKKDELFIEYLNTKYEKTEFKSMEDSNRVKEILDARRLTPSKWLKKHLQKNTIGKSNGETAYEFFLDTIKENAIYLIDEPENSLSPKRQIELKKYIEEASRYFNCQFIISTHSPFISAIEGAKIYNLDSSTLKEIKWDDLENVKLYKDFFNK